MIEVLGVSVSKGIAIGTAIIFTTEIPSIEKYQVVDVESELLRLKEAVRLSEKQLETIVESEQANFSNDMMEILEIQKVYLQDTEFMGAIEAQISLKRSNAEAAVQFVTDKTKNDFKSVEDEYFRQRILDIQDLSQRLLRNLFGIENPDVTKLPEASIIVASELTPSDILSIDLKNVVGFCVGRGSTTSHAAIIARNLGIPAIIGINVSDIKQGDRIILDGFEGKILLYPDPFVLEEYEKKRKRYQGKSTLARLHFRLPVSTLDGEPIKVFANIGNVHDAEIAVENGAEGVGLFRTEFLFLRRNTPPSEDDQYRTYCDAAEAFRGRPVTIRTLDIGGDKQTLAVPLPKEENPFLGMRAIRLCLERQDIFSTQLRALLRAGIKHAIRVMIPMIGTMNEWNLAFTAIKEAERSLQSEGVRFPKKIPIGMMIEVPSAAILAESFAKKADFFSIGTNDLSQYTLAADRTNPKVAHLANPLDPSVLRLIKTTLDAGAAYGIEVAMCGEMAGELSTIPLLLGLGLHEFSLSPANISEIKEVIRQQRFSNCKELANRCLEAESIEDVRNIISNA